MGRRVNKNTQPEAGGVAETPEKVVETPEKVVETPEPKPAEPEVKSVNSREEHERLKEQQAEQEEKRRLQEVALAKARKAQEARARPTGDPLVAKVNLGGVSIMVDPPQKKSVLKQMLARFLGD